MLERYLQELSNLTRLRLVVFGVKRERNVLA